ncbi:MAG: ATP-binding protein, partial [Solirubrobacteraceae bacterium]
MSTGEPSTTGTVGSAGLLERESEVAALRRALLRALQGSGRLAMIEGPAGIGKTALLRATRDAAREAGMHVLTARARELEQEFAFGVARQLFEPLLLELGERRRGLLE